MGQFPGLRGGKVEALVLHFAMARLEAFARVTSYSTKSFAPIQHEGER
jgi:hypothetical protein